MSPAIILAIGIGIATALVMALVAARRSGGTIGPERYGRELDAPSGMGGGRRLRPDARRRAVLIIVIFALAALGAGIATGLSNGTH
jgi:hypothetical protein